MFKIWFIRICFSVMAVFVFIGIISHPVVAQENRIEIPSLEVNTEIIPIYIRPIYGHTTWDTRRLYDNIGHLNGTGWFGQNKNVVLAGHSETIDRLPNVFYNLANIEVGAEIYVYANGTAYHYVVTSLEWVVPTDLTSVLPTGHDQLTLITCDTDSYDNGTYEKRLVVRALPA